MYIGYFKELSAKHKAGSMPGNKGSISPFPLTILGVIRSTCKRYCLAGIGLIFIVLGGIGVIVPGLPTVIFWIIAAWCVSKSCPALQRWIYRRPHFGPIVLQFLENRSLDQAMKRRALIGMWLSLVLSSGIILYTSGKIWLVCVIIASGFIATFWIVYGIKTCISPSDNTMECNAIST